MNIWHTKPDSSFNTAMPLTYSCQWQLSPCRANGRFIRQLISARRHPNARPPKIRVKTKAKHFLTFWSALLELNAHLRNGTYWRHEKVTPPCSHLRETCAKYKLYISSLKTKNRKKNKRKNELKTYFPSVGTVWSYIIHVFILSPVANPSPMSSIKSFIVIRPWAMMVSQSRFLMHLLSIPHHAGPTPNSRGHRSDHTSLLVLHTERRRSNTGWSSRFEGVAFARAQLALSP